MQPNLNLYSTTTQTNNLNVSSYCQTPGYVFRLGVDFVLPLSQKEQEEQEQEPSPKIYIEEMS